MTTIVVKRRREWQCVNCRAPVPGPLDGGSGGPCPNACPGYRSAYLLAPTGHLSEVKRQVFNLEMRPDG